MNQKIFLKHLSTTLPMLLTMTLFGCGGGSDPTPTVVSASNAMNRILNVPMSPQQADEWCWAASEQMVLADYGILYPQTDIVAFTYGAVVDMPATAQQIAVGLNSLSRGALNPQIVNGPLAFEQIRSSIDQNLPIIIQYESPYLNEGHFVVVYGYTAQGNLLINDPILGQFNVPYSKTFTYGTSNGAPLVWMLSIIP